MNRISALFLTLCLLLSGCRTAAPPQQVSDDPRLISASDLLERLLDAVPEGGDAPDTVTGDTLSACLSLYSMGSAQVTDCAIARLGGARVFELAVIDLYAPSADAESGLLAYLLNRQGDFIGYAPEQAAIARESKLFTVESGSRLILAITEDTDAIEDALKQAGYTTAATVDAPRKEAPAVAVDPDPVTTDAPQPSVEPSLEPSVEPSVEPTSAPEPTFELPAGWKSYSPPNEDDMTIYDTSAILADFERGSDEGLNRKDRELYQACREILGQIIVADMTDYEKEWAVYSWLIGNVEYDWRHQDILLTTPRDSFRPYGAIVNRTAVCLGFATAFQLFMDLLNVECITVVGAAFSSESDHAWNMVRLSGEWYCVDATWDLGNAASPQWCQYFNVTSDFMAKSDHQWDYANTPMATAADGGKP